LRQISHHILEEFFEFFFALFERGEVDRERFLRAQRFARTIGSTGRSVFLHPRRALCFINFRRRQCKRETFIF
jgi:hypothetical protein